MYISCIFGLFLVKKIRLCFGNVYVVVLGSIVLIILGCGQLCLACYVGILCLCSTTSCSYGCIHLHLYDVNILVVPNLYVRLECFMLVIAVMG
jgi:hypothetical protein